MINVRILILLTLLIGLAVLAIFFFRADKKTTKKGVPISLETFHTSIGWGYDVKVKDTVYIHQPFIPVIEAHTGFKTRMEAENAGKIVIGKLLKNESPALSIEDLQKAGVQINYNFSRSNSATN